MARLPPQYRREFQPDLAKVEEAILFIIKHFPEFSRQAPSQYDVVKSIFMADRNHLNKYGRPITFDDYVAMEHGPVPSLAYDLLKPEADYVHIMGGAEAPWIYHSFGNISRFTSVKREPRLEYLSETDRDELRTAIDIVARLSF